jgi:TRAP-type C4-dicarboxylate transport system substrate-binding protein
VISTKAWDSLSDEQKKIFEKAADATLPSFNKEQDRIKYETVKKFKASGVQVHAMSQEDYQSWLALAHKTAWPEYAAISPAAKGLLESVQALSK